MKLSQIRHYKRPSVTFISFMLWAGIKDHFKPLKNFKSKKIVLDPQALQIWMIGHATVFINFFGTTILTDPVFAKSLPFPKRAVPPGYSISELPRIDFILLSHAHPDHCNLKSLRALAPHAARIITPKSCSDLIRDMEYREKIELQWNKTEHFPGLSIQAVRPVHWGQRNFWNRKHRGYNSYIIQKNGQSIFFCGDSAYGKFFREVGRRHRIKVALLPIGAYHTPNVRKHHMGPYDAIQAFTDLRAQHMIPIHWGNFRLSFEPLEEPARVLHKLSRQTELAENIHLLRNGENIRL